MERLTLATTPHTFVPAVLERLEGTLKHLRGES